MSYDPATTQAREELLRAAHRVMAGRIDDTLPGPNDGAEAEYAEDGLAEAARRLTLGPKADVQAALRDPELEKLSPDSPARKLLTQLAADEGKFT